MSVTSTGNTGFESTRPAFSENQKKAELKNQHLGPHSLYGGMNIAKNKRTSNIAMSAGFAPNGSRLPSKKNTTAEPEFTITHNDDVNERPWGFPR